MAVVARRADLLSHNSHTFRYTHTSYWNETRPTDITHRVRPPCSHPLTFSPLFYMLRFRALALVPFSVQRLELHRRSSTRGLTTARSGLSARGRDSSTAARPRAAPTPPRGSRRVCSAATREGRATKCGRQARRHQRELSEHLAEETALLAVALATTKSI